MHAFERNAQQELQITNVTHVILLLSRFHSLPPSPPSPPLSPTHHKGLLILEEHQLVPHIKMDARGSSCVPDLQGLGGQSPCKKPAESSNGGGARRRSS